MGLGVKDTKSEIRPWRIDGALVSPIDALDQRVLLLKILYIIENRE